jgi:sugar fermentation stimulation protein A
MRYRKVIPGVFLQRPNRFIAYCEIDGNVEKCLSRTLGNAISS